MNPDDFYFEAQDGGTWLHPCGQCGKVLDNENHDPGMLYEDKPICHECARPFFGPVSGGGEDL